MRAPKRCRPANLGPFDKDCQYILRLYITGIYFRCGRCGLDKLDNGDLRQDAYSAGIADESKTPVDI
jgi:hypothetical protein